MAGRIGRIGRMLGAGARRLLVALSVRGGGALVTRDGRRLVRR